MGAVRRLVLDGCTVATMDPHRTEHAVGHMVVEGSRIAAVGPGRWVDDGSGAEVHDATGCLLTPGLVNTHHHLYQWATRGLAVDSTLFGWLTELYPVWGGIDEDVVGAAAAAGLGWLARTGCTTSMDHHYVFPTHGGDVLGAEIEAARRIGLRFLATRGSMDLGRSKGGLPPDHVVEDLDTILTATGAAIDTHHDPSPDSMLRIGVAPCSPFSVTADLLRESAALARDRGVRLHTHLAETTDEEQYCAERFGLSPLAYLESLGWLGGDVWLAHGIHFDDAAIGVLGATRTGVAHCPSSNARLGAGIARTRDLRDAGVPVGLGVDGAASNEASSLVEEARHALLFARARGGPEALGVRDALELATIGGARVLGWDDQIGSLEVGKQADVALWRLDGLGHAGVVDPVAALVLGSQPPLELLLVGGRPVVERDRLATADEESLAAQAVSAGERLLDRHRERAGYISATP
ncbi:Cytosine/adenosine deaminase [Pedococcus dokdonensis]|uniref:Cytosine/adenosine deaminase n=1 Tax=Pedococcus dokdonensis TaxID=443156 RepID=A0A1H0ULG5_9MICO|nr:8-oxoguanine deaminase [Pedococcus dokdonensis]SDP66913.1 Cytosine/adenosine deaminase [Pedococcus dokdonensis]